MSDRYFLDTSIFVYSLDPTDPVKQRSADAMVRGALGDGRGVISYQVIQEFCSVAPRKFAESFTWSDLRDYLQTVLARLCDVHSSFDLFADSLEVVQQTGYSYHDALIVAAAARAGCSTLYTEDLQHGQTVAGVKIVNPF